MEFIKNKLTMVGYMTNAFVVIGIGLFFAYQLFAGGADLHQLELMFGYTDVCHPEIGDVASYCSYAPGEPHRKDFLWHTEAIWR